MKLLIIILLLFLLIIIIIITIDIIRFDFMNKVSIKHKATIETLLGRTKTQLPLLKEAVTKVDKAMDDVKTRSAEVF